MLVVCCASTSCMGPIGLRLGWLCHDGSPEQLMPMRTPFRHGCRLHRSDTASCKHQDITRGRPKVFRPRGHELSPGRDPRMQGETGWYTHLPARRWHTHVARIAATLVLSGLSSSRCCGLSRHLLHCDPARRAYLRSSVTAICWHTLRLGVSNTLTPRQSAAELECFLFCLTGPRDK